MEGLQVHVPAPRPSLAGALERHRAAVAEERAAAEDARHRAERIEARARGRARADAYANTCPACGFGGYRGRCAACTYTPEEGRTEY